MKKWLSSLVLLLLVCMPVSVMGEGPNTILINGDIAEIPEEMGSIKAFSDRTFVPVRFVLEYFNYSVSWDDKEKLVFGRNDAGNVFVMQIGSPLLIVKYKNEQPENIVMDVEPILSYEEGRTYIPIRFLAQALGYNVGYDDLTGTVMLDK